MGYLKQSTKAAVLLALAIQLPAAAPTVSDQFYNAIRADDGYVSGLTSVASASMVQRSFCVSIWNWMFFGKVSWTTL